VTQRPHRTDQELQSAISDELQYDPSVSGAHIAVSVKDGAVTLSGQVATLPQKLSANRSAMRMRGVSAVVDHVTVVHPGNTDADLAETARRMLTWTVGVPDKDVTVTVHDHVLTLSGNVTWNYQRDAAWQAVTGLRGITAVDNKISLRQPGSAMPTQKAITAAFERNALLDPEAIKVEVDGHALVLTGTVHSFAEYRQAEHTVWSSPGVTTVRNDLHIAS
jgi:osmotically-inducible protein OsmY